MHRQWDTCTRSVHSLSWTVSISAVNNSPPSLPGGILLMGATARVGANYDMQLVLGHRQRHSIFWDRNFGTILWDETLRDKDWREMTGDSGHGPEIPGHGRYRGGGTASAHRFHRPSPPKEHPKDGWKFEQGQTTKNPILRSGRVMPVARPIASTPIPRRVSVNA